MREGPARTDLHEQINCPTLNGRCRLAEIEDPERIMAIVKPLHAVLDDPATKPWGVRETLAVEDSAP